MNDPSGGVSERSSPTTGCCPVLDPAARSTYVRIYSRISLGVFGFGRVVKRALFIFIFYPHSPRPPPGMVGWGGVIPYRIVICISPGGDV